MRGGGGQKMSVFVHAQGIKTVHAGVGGSKTGKILSTQLLNAPLLKILASLLFTFTFLIFFFPHFREQVLYIGGSALEVSKSQKQIFLKLYFPKNERNIGFGLGNRTLIELFGSGKTVKHCFGRSLGHHLRHQRDYQVGFNHTAINTGHFFSNH